MIDLIRQKSLLIVEADRLREFGSRQGACQVYAEAARIEEHLANQLRSKGDPDHCINALSAASCWLAAGRDEAAARLLDRLAAAELAAGVRAEVRRLRDALSSRQRAAASFHLQAPLPTSAACSVPGAKNGVSDSLPAPHWRGRAEIERALAA